MTGFDPEVVALRALSEGDREKALGALADSARPLLNAALRSYLADSGDERVYDQPAAFAAFIRGGGNVGLYESVSKALAARYSGVTSLLDIGCGDGTALVPALADAHPAITLVEPSAALLDGALAALAGRDVTAHNTDALTFTASMTGHFDLVESTFALHALPPGERSTVLRNLRGHVSRVAIAEFDVPAHPTGSDAHLTFLADTYEQGLGEYTDDRDLVAQGFLMPVLTGQLAPGAHRNTWEQPAAEWARQLTECGYRDVEITPLFDYWSSPAFLVVAVA